MNKLLKFALGLGAVTAGAVAAAAYLTAPEKPSHNKTAPFDGRNIAHRGLFTSDQSIPENSLPAFDAAAEAGYGIELDVHITDDDRIVVFHDDTLERVCGELGRVEDSSWKQLKELYLFDTTEHMPLLSEVLNLIDGRCPIILELKSDKRRTLLCERTLEYIRCYNGEVCVESFDPRIVGWFRLNAPNLYRGQLSQCPADFGEDCSKIQAFAIGNLLTNIIARPNFVAYKIGKKPLLVKLCQCLGAKKVSWTSGDTTAEAKNDTVIFEHYRPSIRFR